MNNVPNANPSFLISPIIKYATLTIDLNVMLQKWCYVCNFILTNLGGASISLTSLF